MGQNLYQDAIAEARQLREMAEQNAKNVIIDAVTPRIRKLIEQQLVEGGADETELVPDEAMPDEEVEAGPVAVSAGGDDAAGDTSVRVGSGGDVEIEVGGVSISLDTGDEGGAEAAPDAEPAADDEVLLDDAVAEALARVVASSNSSRKKIRGKIRILERRVGLLREALAFAKKSKNQKVQLKAAKIFESLAREAVSLRESVIITEQNTNGGVLDRARVDAIIKEMKDMSKRNNRNIFDFLFEAEDSQATGRQALSELDLVLSDEDLEALGVEDPEEASVDALDVQVVADSADEGEGEDEMEDEGEEEVEELEEVYEIDENALRREIHRLRRLNEDDPVAGSGDSSFGGGDAEDEMFVDVDEDDLLDALEDELGSVSDVDDAGPALPESRRRRMRRRQRRIAESRRRGRKASTSTQRQLNEYKKAAHALKAQLTEMNLFNAKLLYANKLMQNRNLSQKQQRAIVEALDNAKTLREAKLLYQSLTKSLNKVPRKNLNEGSLRTLGSSSRSTRSGAPANSGVEVDRWATLAGLNKD